MRFLRWGATCAALIALIGCGQGTKLYSPQDAKRAFVKEGFVLVPMFPRQSRDRRSRILIPRSSEPFTVVVASTVADAKYAYRKLRREATRQTFDLRARNIVTISDTGLTDVDKARLRRAMRRLR